ncbi:hypothetical protein M5D96_012002 [Drosophila gunungcola]|uniref:TATA box-binding protein-like 1 n=1 Tax=Drosophila gunungcola TaxID=103775 RepID=A0A9P9YE25_9MUSC|nr:hypothetical protein M5D96_012002 [Drosophila gunungcola]
MKKSESPGKSEEEEPDQVDDNYKSTEAPLETRRVVESEEDTEDEDSEEEEQPCSPESEEEKPDQIDDYYQSTEAPLETEGVVESEENTEDEDSEKEEQPCFPESEEEEPDQIDDNNKSAEAPLETEGVAESEEDTEDEESEEEEQQPFSPQDRHTDTDTGTDSDSDPEDKPEPSSSEENNVEQRQNPKGGGEDNDEDQGSTSHEDRGQGPDSEEANDSTSDYQEEEGAPTFQENDTPSESESDSGISLGSDTTALQQTARKRKSPYSWEERSKAKYRKIDQIVSQEKRNNLLCWIQQKQDLYYQNNLRQEQQQQQKQLEKDLNTLPQRKCELMQNDMVSIPVANLNGGLKAAGSGSGVGVAATGGVVSSAVLANAPRVYLTPSSTFMANRQATAGMVAATGKLSGSMVGGGSGGSTMVGGTSSAAGTVRYFSQFSKVQTAGGPSLQRKLVNGDTIVLANGNKGLFLTSSSSSSDRATALSTIAANGNCSLQAKTELLEEEDMQPGTVIQDDEEEDEMEVDGDGNGDSDKDEDDDDDDEKSKPSAPQDQPLALTTTSAEGNASDDEPELDIVINNVVCSFSVGCHLKLREIALQGSNVEYRRENGMVTMKLRHPYTTASIWSSGRITCTGATSESMAKVAARRYARCLGKLGFPTRFQNFRIVNVLGTCSMPWAIKIVNFSERHRENASYEPELHPGVTYKMRDPDPKATLKIFSTGSVTVTAASVSHVESAIQHIYPLVFEFRKQRSPEELQHLRQKQRQQTGGADPNELESQVVSENKVAAQDNIFINTTAAHTKPSPGDNTPATSGIMSSTIDSTERLKQLESYHQMMQRTQVERRHIPFQGEKVASASTSAAAAKSSGDNICANARRRATECWATKLQNKRPRYNDPGTTGSVNASGTAATSSSSSSASVSASASVAFNVASSSLGSNQSAYLRNPLKTAALANARMRGAKVPTGMVLKPGTRIAPTSGFLHQQHQQHQQLQQQQQQQKMMRQTSFSPSDFQVDDLIEEEERNELDLLQY